MAIVSALKVTAIDGTALATALEFTEHNRSSIPLQFEQIETAERMANGTMRKYVIAKKKSLSISWSDLPSSTVSTVDAKLGGGAIKAFYDQYCTNRITLAITHYNTTSVTAPMTTETLDVFITGFSYEITKRLQDDSAGNGYDRVNITISFTEI